ncbi:MAG: TonB C-terminal domain-containing protein [Victivallaceae bacterium]|nr:TonB C-terminal domain-containing protein [Victivallaceae bacterium]
MKGKFHKQNEAKAALVDLRTRKKIFHTVLITHVVIISMIIVWGFAVDFFKPKRPKSITVSLYTPPETSGTPPAYTPPKTKTKAAAKKTPKKKVIKKPKKKWKPAKKIKVSKDLVYVKPVKTRPRIKPMDKQKLLNYLKQNRVKIRSNTQNTGIAQKYENSVGAYLYQLWDTPDKSILSGKHPEVKIQLNIAANGQLLNARILKPSGITAMDKSIQKLLQKIKYLPVPSNGAQKITLILEVIE